MRKWAGVCYSYITSTHISGNCTLSTLQWFLKREMIEVTPHCLKLPLTIFRNFRLQPADDSTLVDKNNSLKIRTVQGRKNISWNVHATCSGRYQKHRFYFHFQVLSITMVLVENIETRILMYVVTGFSLSLNAREWGLKHQHRYLPSTELAGNNAWGN